MDSKFGPDGALYVQTYDGFFRAGPNIGLYRYDYVGGAPTPGAARGRSRSARSASASRAPAPAASRGSGTSATARSPTEANPTHTYAEAKRYTATLTVTYADGAKDTKTVDVDVLAQRGRDAAGDHGRADPGQPGRRRHLHASRHRHADRDRRGRRQRRGHDRVPRQRRRLDSTTTAPDPPRAARHVPDRVPLDGPHGQRRGDQVDRRSRSRSPENCPTNFNDEFNGPALDPKWTSCAGTTRPGRSRTARCG